MDEQQLTDWFPPEVLPARPGGYQREYTAGEVSWMNSDPDYWDGEHWYYGDGEGWHDPRPEAGPPNLRWRGLAEPPLTDWYPPEVLPVRPGPYIREWAAPDLQAAADFFDGKHWFNGSYDLETGEREFSPTASLSELRWRGLAVQP